MKKILLFLLIIPQILLSQEYTIRGNIVPDASGTRDIGTDTLFYKTLRASEIKSSVFSSTSNNLIGGTIRISKRSGILQSRAWAISTTMNFETAMTIGDIVELKDAGRRECVRIVSWVSGYTYVVARNIDLSGSDYWLKGTPYSVLGQNGNGWIDIKSWDKTSISMYAVHDTTYNNWNEILRIGDLNGNWGYSGEQYGMVVGSYANNSSYITIDTVNGIRIRHRSGVGIVSDVFRVEPDGDAYFTGNVTLSNQASITLSGFNNDAGFNHVYYGSSTPSTPAVGDIWFKQAVGDTCLKRYNGATWDKISARIDANGLYADNIYANQITAGTLTGFTIQTNATPTTNGVVIDNTGNGQIRFYDTSVNRVLVGSNIFGLGEPGIGITDGTVFLKSTGYSTSSLYTSGNDVYLASGATGSVNLVSAVAYVNGEKIWTNGNDGTGSLLDADMLDTKHASDFSLSSHNHSGVYAPAAQGAAFDNHSATSSRYVATSSGGSPTTQMGWVGLTINGVRYTIFTSD